MSIPGPGYISPNFKKIDEWKNTGTSEVMVFRPSMEEFKDFTSYLTKIEEMGAHLASGICKIIPPPEWTPRPIRGKSYSDVLDYVIESPVKEKIEGVGGKFIKINKIYRKTMTVGEFERLAISDEYSNPKPNSDLIELERQVIDSNFGVIQSRLGITGDLFSYLLNQ